MSRTVVFCSTQQIPNDVFSEEVMLEIASGFGSGSVMGFTSELKSNWKQFLDDPAVGAIVLIGVEDPAEYEVPADGLTPVLEYLSGKLVPCKFQVINKKNVMIFSSMDPAQLEPTGEAARA